MAGTSSFKKQWWVSFSIIFGVMAVAAAGLYYLSGDLAAQSAKIVSDRNFIAEQTALVANLARLKGDAAQATPYLTAMQKLLPTHEALIGLSQWVTAFAQANGVSATFAFQGGKTAPSASSPGSDGFSLTVSGPMDGIVSFMSDLETKAPGFLLSIDSFDFVDNGSAYTISAQGNAFSR